MKQRKEAPAGVVVQGYSDERARIAAEYNRKNPDFRHVWAPNSWTTEDFGRRHMEVVRDEDGRTITNGISVLCRMPRELAEAPFVRGAEESLRRLLTAMESEAASQELSLRKKSSFKAPSGAGGNDGAK